MSAAARRARDRRRDSEKRDDIDDLTATLYDASAHATIDFPGASAVDFSALLLKPDHEERPFWITPTGSIFLEATSSLYEQARDFLVAICEPISRPEFVHEYRLDKNALFAAASMGLTADLIISALSKMSKVPVDSGVVQYIRACTSGYGKCKLVLKRGKYFVESSYPSLLRQLIVHPVIRSARVHYGPDGKRMVGGAAPDGGAHAAAAAALSEVIVLDDDEDAGFEVSETLAETEGSLGLKGILRPGGGGVGGGKRTGKGDADGGMGDTRGGTLSARFIGEVESDEEDAASSGSSGGGGGRAFVPSGKSKHLCSVAAASQSAANALRGGGLGADTSFSSGLDDDDFNALTAEEIQALLAAVDEAEAALTAAKAAPPSTTAAAAASSAAANTAREAGAAPLVIARRPTSFAGDVQRGLLGGAAVPVPAASVAAATATSAGSGAGSAKGRPSAAGAGAGAPVASGKVPRAASLTANTTSSGARDDEKLPSLLPPRPAPQQQQTAPAVILPAADSTVATQQQQQQPSGGFKLKLKVSAPVDSLRSASPLPAAAAALAVAADTAYSAVAPVPAVIVSASQSTTTTTTAVLFDGGNGAGDTHSGRSGSDAPPAKRVRFDGPYMSTSADAAAATATAQGDGVERGVEDSAPSAPASTTSEQQQQGGSKPSRGPNTILLLDDGSSSSEGSDVDDDAAAAIAADDEDDVFAILDSEEEEDLVDMGIVVAAKQSTRGRAAPSSRPAPARRGSATAYDDEDGDGDVVFVDEQGGSSGGGSSDDDDSEDDGFRRRRRGKASAAARKKKAAATAAAKAKGKGVSSDGSGKSSTAADEPTRGQYGSSSRGDKGLRAAESLWKLSEAHARSTPGRSESFEIDAPRVEAVRKVCRDEFLLPLVQEYDFRHDTVLPTLRIALRDASALRPYQERSLAKMFGNGRARSGIIVLPCGAGKTLVGIAAAATMGKSCIVLCPNQTSVQQWVEQFARFTDVRVSSLVTLTAKKKEPLPDLHEAVILLTTYSMIGRIREENAYYGSAAAAAAAGHGGGKKLAKNARRGGVSAESEAILAAIAAREWGLMLLDEVHQAVANTFKKALRLRAHCRLGLTATLVREDGKDRHLAYLIGPKLYEANWRDLTRAGYLANVQVTEVWCPMTPQFYREFLRASSMNARKALAVMNPVKCWAMDRLLDIHEKRGDKIIVFSESVFALKLYATQYNTIAICGDTPMLDRETFIRAFKTPSSGVNKLFLSRVGDVALDVPDANVIIQISSHYGSRLQEAQRMGRILRRGSAASASSGFNSFFYTLISTDTMETYFSNKRRRYLVDQGYAYVVRPADGLVPPDEVAKESAMRGFQDDDEADALSLGAAAASARGDGGGRGVIDADGATSSGTKGASASSFFSVAGMEALRKGAKFMTDLPSQLRVLELVLRENLDAIEGLEDKEFAEYAPEFELAKASRDAARSSIAPAPSSSSSSISPGAGLAARTLTGRQSVGEVVAAASASAVPVVRRSLGTMAGLSGGAGLYYLEYEAERGGLEALRNAEETERMERRPKQQHSRDVM